MAEEGGVTVCVRLRPLIARESEDLEDKVQISWKSEGNTVSQVDGTKSFVFDRVFHSNDSTAEVFQGVAAPIIKSAVQGYNGTIFAYGQTASGKTYTMLGTKENPGILPLAIHDVFNTICKIPTREFLLRISYMEIHNETIQDLLCSNIREKKPLVVREDINRTIYVEDLSEKMVNSPEKVLNWLQKGEKNRHYGETKMNERSSRSHTIFRMIIESKERTDASSSSCEGAVMVSHLNLVDLAGSERASQAGAEGIRLKEGCNINRSLFILGQVIKKLCDDQSGNGFINYRDSKLTRILQNSLGGNAKTVIICTATPVSLEETLSTLQFASTAKKMKNTPKVNEVIDDDALLKRYRKEIEDLKRQLEEVSSHAPTKDQIAQLLEEKNSLQKEQQDRIRALSEMLVTASSCSKGKVSKARLKRRVTWAPGVINQNENLCFLEDPPVKSKRSKTSFCSLPEMEESACSEFSEYDDQAMTAGVTLPGEEWVPGSETNFMSHKDFAESVQLCETLVEERNNAVTELQTLKAKLENLQVENKHLRCELTELREEMSTEEFVTLENKTAKEHEMQLMHENSNLKAIIANAEVYNQDMQEEIKLKDVQLKEQKNKMEVLENNVTELKRQLEEFKAESGKREVSSMQMSNKGMDEVQQLNQSLRDAEAVALDAKKDLSIFRSENLALKEKMTQLSDTYNQMGKDLECCRSQLEVGKVTYRKMQSDLQKELQYYFQENAKLASLLEGKVPKELLSSVELERKIEDLKNELNKAMEENTTLRKESTTLAEAASGPDPKIFQKEILEKSELIASLTSEKDSLLSQVAEKERLLQEMTDVLKSKGDLANAREKDTDFQELKHQYDELKQKLLTTSEESKQMKGQVDLLSDENLKLNVTIHDLTQELSCKIEELQKKDFEQEKFLRLKEELDEAHQKLSEMEQLKDRLNAWESKMEVEDTEKLAKDQRVHNGREETGLLTQERDELTQKEEALQQERDKIKAELQETVSTNIAIKEELRNASNSLNQYQNRIKEMEDSIAERDTQISSIKESLESTIDEQKQQILKLTEDLECITMEKNLTETSAKEKENNELQLLTEQILSLEEEKSVLQQQLKDLLAEKNQYLESHQLLAKEGEELKTEDTESHLKEELCRALKKISEMEELGEQLKATESVMGEEITDTVTLVQQLHQKEDSVRALTQERDDLGARQDLLPEEMDQLKIELQATQSTILEKSELIASLTSEKDSLLSQVGEKERLLQEMTEALKSKGDLAKAEKMREKDTDFQELKHQYDEMKQKLLTTSEESKQMKNQVDLLSDENLKLNIAIRDLTQELSLKVQELQEKGRELEALHGMKEQLDGSLLRQNLVNQLEEELKAEKVEKMETSQRLWDSEEKMKSLIQERDDLKQKMEAVQMERDALRALEDKTSLKIQQLIEESSDLKKLLDLREKQNQQVEERLNELQRLKATLESRITAMEQEKAELDERFRNTMESMRTLTQENESLKTTLQTPRTEDEDMIRTIHRLGETVAQTVASNLKLQEQLREAHSSMRKTEELITDKDSTMKQMFEEMERLQAQVNTSEEQVNRLKSQTEDKDHLYQQLEAKYVEEKEQLTKKLNESLNLDTSEKDRLVAKLKDQTERVQQLMKEGSLLQKERDDLQQAVQSITAESDQLQAKVLELTAKLKESLSLDTAEKDGLVAKLKDQTERVQQLMKEGSLLQKERDDLQQAVQSITAESDQLQAKVLELTAKLNESLSLDTAEKDRLVAKLKDQTERVQQLMKEGSLLQKERDDLQKAVQSIAAENDQLQAKVLELTAKFSKTNANVEKQGNIENLESKVLRIKEVLKQFPVLENRSECFKNTSLQIKCELDNQKSLLAKVLVDLSPLQTSRAKTLHMEHEAISNGLHSMLNKVQFHFTRLCKKKTEYYTNISTYTAELLEERRKQHELQMHIRGLRKPCLEEPQGFASQEVNVAELSQDLDLYKEQILKDISGLEEELFGIEEQLQKMKSDGEEVKRHVGRCLANFDVQDFEAGIKHYNEILMPVGRFLKTKSQVYIQARTELETKNAEYYKESEAALKACREETKKLFLELNTLRDEQKSCVTNLALEEENYKLQNKLQATEQDLKKLELKIQELENEANEAERNHQEMEKRTYALQTQLTSRTSKREVVRLQAALEEKENCLARSLAERETLKAQVDRGAEPYKEEIEDLKTQLVKADMARMKQSKFFQQEMANAKALAEHREEQLRKIKEELRHAQQEQDVTVIANRDLPQTSLPITCGGGSGIVQNTQVMVVKMEHVKLEKKYNQLKKEYDLLLATDLALKEEVKKWKERALRRREQSLRSTDEEQRLKSPRKTAPAFFPGLPCSPSRESSLKPVCPLDTPPAATLNSSGFFADPRQGNSTERRHEREESSEMNLKQWIASADKDDAKNCKTQ